MEELKTTASDGTIYSMESPEVILYSGINPDLSDAAKINEVVEIHNFIVADGGNNVLDEHINIALMIKSKLMEKENNDEEDEMTEEKAEQLASDEMDEFSKNAGIVGQSS